MGTPIRRTYAAIAGVLFIIAVVAVGSSQAADRTEADGQGHATLERVAAKYVCMPNNKRFPKEQIPVEIDGKTYYGCCKMCVNMLKLDPKVRTAVDPVNGKAVDKAVAVIGAAADETVYYFENEENLRRFTPHAETD